jgi:squalene cyclase
VALTQPFRLRTLVVSPVASATVSWGRHFTKVSGANWNLIRIWIYKQTCRPVDWSVRRKVNKRELVELIYSHCSAAERVDQCVQITSF